MGSSFEQRYSTIDASELCSIGFLEGDLVVLVPFPSLSLIFIKSGRAVSLPCRLADGGMASVALNAVKAGCSFS